MDTAWMKAASNGHIGIVKLLIEAGGKDVVNAKDKVSLWQCQPLLYLYIYYNLLGWKDCINETVNF
jgi:hypothetical protein